MDLVILRKIALHLEHTIPRDGLAFALCSKYHLVSLKKLVPSEKLIKKSLFFSSIRKDFEMINWIKNRHPKISFDADEIMGAVYGEDWPRAIKLIELTPLRCLLTVVTKSYNLNVNIQFPKKRELSLNATLKSNSFTFG